MISYVVPVYRGGDFFGVAGIDFSYDSLVANMEDIDEFDSGYAFLANRDGEIIYHRDLETGTQITDSVPAELLAPAEDGNNSVIRYTYNGIEKRAASAELDNDMKLVVTIDESEASEGVGETAVDSSGVSGNPCSGFCFYHFMACKTNNQTAQRADSRCSKHLMPETIMSSSNTIRMMK